MSIFAKPVTLAQLLLAARRRYEVGLWSVIRRFLTLNRMKYSPTEMAQLELLDTRRDVVFLQDFISNEALLKIQAALNPVSLHDQTEDKRQFHRRCAEHGFPLPDTVAEIMTGENFRVVADGIAYPAGDALDRLCATLHEGDYILKPSQGCHGVGVLALSVARELPARALAATELERHLDRFSGFDSWLLQERLRNHSDVLALSPSEALQTIRIVTCVETSGNVGIVAAQWRLADSQACIDNFNGASGGLLCNIVPATGAIETCWRQKKDYPREFGFEVHRSHPATGKILVGRKAPFWEEAVDLASRAATAFLPSRAIGWDIAVTDRGVVLIEGNRYWDPHNEDARMGERLRHLTAQIGPDSGLATAAPR